MFELSTLCRNSSGSHLKNTNADEILVQCLAHPPALRFGGQARLRLGNDFSGQAESTEEAQDGHRLIVRGDLVSDFVSDQ